jgi:outer membrane receptor protein involved in Fe transport
MRTRWWQLTVAALVVGLLGFCPAVPAAVADDETAPTGIAEQGAPPAPTAETKAPEQPAGAKAARKDESPAALGQEEPEIEVEVVGKKVGEQPVQSLAPTTGEVITSINAAELKATGETNLADALEFLPGVTVTHQGRRFETFVNVRAASTPVVLLDGALISSGIFANRILYTLPFSAIERVDVIRSSSSLIYGPQALSGGVVNIVTRSGRGKTKGEYRAYDEVGSFDYRHFGIGVGQGDADSGQYLVADHDNANSNLEFGGHALQRLFLKLDQNLRNGDPLKFSIMSVDGRRRFDVWDKDWQIFAKTAPAYWGIDPYREKVATLAYSHPFSPQNNTGLDLLFWWRYQFYHNFTYGGPVQPAKLPATTFYDEAGNIYGQNVMFRLQPARDHYLRVGMEHWRLDGYTQDFVLQKDRTTLVPQPRVPYWTSAAGSQPAASRLLGYYAQDEWAIKQGTRFFYGGRYEIPGLGLHNALTYALGLEREMGAQATLYAHLGTGVSYPTPSALASNPKLRTQTSDNIDVGIERRFSFLQGRVGWFRSAVSNYFVSYLKTGGDVSKSTDYIQVQADYTRSGWEAELEGAVPSAQSLRYFANYTLLHQDVGRIPMAEGRPLQLAVPPRGQFSLGLRWSSPDALTRLALSYTNVDAQLARSGYYALAYPLPGYHYANLTASRELGAGWALSAAMNNMFDEDYESQPGFPRPGRNYVFGISRSGSFK